MVNPLAPFCERCGVGVLSVSAYDDRQHTFSSWKDGRIHPVCERDKIKLMDVSIEGVEPEAVMDLIMIMDRVFMVGGWSMQQIERIRPIYDALSDAYNSRET